MKKVLFIAVLLLTTLGYSQKKVKPIAEYNTTEANITALTFSVDSEQGLKSINWNDVKEIFENNTNPKQLLKLTVEVDLPKSKNKMKASITIQEETKNIDKLIIRAKKVVSGLIKIINKNK